MTREITMIPIKGLRPHVLHEHIYGKPEDDDTFEDLVAEVKNHGVLQPLVVDASGTVFSGGRRLAAAKKLKLKEVPAEVNEYGSEQDEIQAIISYNEYRVKTKLQKVKEGLVYQEMLKKIISAKGSGKDIPEGQILNSIANADGKVVTRDGAGKAVGMSPRTIQTGKKVVETIEDLKAEGREDEAAEIEKKAETSIAGAAALADKAKPKVGPKDPQEILYWYVSQVRRISVTIRSQTDSMRKKVNSKTPAGFTYFLENLERIADRVDTWMPNNMGDCPVCHGTMSINGHPCSICIQGKTGGYQVPEDITVEEEDLKPPSAYCGTCGEELIASDQTARMVQGTMICGPCQLRKKQLDVAEGMLDVVKDDIGNSNGPPPQKEPTNKPLTIAINCEECGDKVGYYDKDGEEYLNLDTVNNDNGDYLCGACSRELASEA